MRDKGINSSVIKLIAVITMLIDHIGVILQENISVQAFSILRTVGRISFPLFCFCIVQGFIHTSSFKRYFIRMAGFAVISEIPFNLMLNRTVLYPERSNVMLTFVIALLVLYGCSKLVNHGWKGMLLTFVIVTLGMAAAYGLKTDYSWKCILLVTFMYFARYDEAVLYISGTIVLWLGGGVREVFAPLSFILIHFYNGQKGSMPKYFFYIFYPAHMFVLGLIAALLL